MATTTFTFLVPKADLRDFGNTRHGITSVKEEKTSLSQDYEVTVTTRETGPDVAFTVTGPPPAIVRLALLFDRKQATTIAAQHVVDTARANAMPRPETLQIARCATGLDEAYDYAIATPARAHVANAVHATVNTVDPSSLITEIERLY